MAYYVGFAYMMMRRYADAIRTFSSVLLYLQRAKQLFQSRTYQNDQVNIEHYLNTREVFESLLRMLLNCYTDQQTNRTDVPFAINLFGFTSTIHR